MALLKVIYYFNVGFAKISFTYYINYIYIIIYKLLLLLYSIFMFYTDSLDNLLL